MRSFGRRHREPGRRWRLGDAFWLAVPVLSLLAVAAYFSASAMLGVTPPFAVVDGQSMRPTMTPGDLVILRGVPGQKVEVGDVISIAVPEEVQEEKSLPAEVVHRVVEKNGRGSEVTFVTQGDNNPGEDAFITRPGMVRGEVIRTVPALGYPVLFLRSSQGRIFLGALGLAVVGYFVIAAVERRQEAAERENPARAIEDLGAELRELREAVTTTTAPAAAPIDPNGLTRLVDEHTEDRETIRELVGAVRKYGEHLRSHTRAVQEMAAAAQDLARAAEQIRRSLGDTDR